MAAEVKTLLRKLDFPAVVLEALGQLQKILVTPVTPMVVELCNEILEEFVFLEKRRKKLTAIRELHLLDVMCTCFQTMSQESGRNLFFVMFPPSDRQLLDRRMPILSRFVSLAVTLNVDILLDCAAFWIHVAGVNSDVSSQLTRQLLRELFDGTEVVLSPVEPNGSTQPLSAAPVVRPAGVQLVHTSPAFCATIVTTATFLYPTSLPPRRLLYLLSAWLDFNLFLAFVPLESVMPTAHTFVPGLVAWTTVAGLSPETLADNGVNGLFNADRLDIGSESDAAVVNRLHLALLKMILKAPQGTLQADHLVKLAHSLQTRIGTNSHVNIAATWRVERFVQIIQAALSSRCVHGSLRSLRGALSRLPPTQLTGIVLETNKTVLLA